MKEYVLAVIAGMWLADGISLLAIPRFVIERVRVAIQAQLVLWPWQLLSSIAGLILGIAAFDLPYQPLWLVCGGGMILKGLFIAFGPEPWRDRALIWSLGREDVDYRFWGLGLCTLALMLLHALGWIGQGERALR
jgi:hypothetical protein